MLMQFINVKPKMIIIKMSLKRYSDEINEVGLKMQYRLRLNFVLLCSSLPNKKYILPGKNFVMALHLFVILGCYF